MNFTSERRLATIIFRAAGILIILIGLILTTSAIIQLMALSSLTSEMPRGMKVNITGPIGNMRGWGIIVQLSISAWGLAVYLLSDWLSSNVVREMTDTTVAGSDQ